MPYLKDVAVPAREAWPSVSILFAGRDEEEKLPRALPTLLAQEYPRFEVVAVDDRSRDATGKILDSFAEKHARLKTLHVRELPPGWLGKPHGLQRAYEASSGEWLVFTDADVRFAPEVLRRAVALAEQRGWDHLTLLGRVEMESFWESVLLSFFMMSFTLFSEAWRVSDPLSGKYAGVGAFQLIRRSAYEAIGTHRRLAMEVIDDMKLGKLVKMGKFRSGVGVANELVSVRWHAGVRNIIRGTEKNFFAGADYSPVRAVLQLLALLVSGLLPWVALFTLNGTPCVLAVISAVISAAMQGASAREGGVSVLYGLTYPLGTVIFAYMLVHSAAKTLWRGGVTWRDTFYPLAELRKGIV